MSTILMNKLRNMFKVSLKQFFDVLTSKFIHIRWYAENNWPNMQNIV